MASNADCVHFLFLLVMCVSISLGNAAESEKSAPLYSSSNQTAAQENNEGDARGWARESRKLGGDDYEDLGWSSEGGDSGDKKNGLNLLNKALESIGHSEILGKVKELVSTLGKGVEDLKDLAGGKGGKGGEEEFEEEDWHGDVEHEQDHPYPNIPIIDVPGKKKVGPPLTFGNYNRVGVGSFVDALAVCVATVVWLTFFGLVLPLFYGGQLGRRRRRSLDDGDLDDDAVNGGRTGLSLLTHVVSNVLENGDCFEYVVCKGGETFPSSSRRLLPVVSMVAQIPSENISRPASRIRRALASRNCEAFQCNRR